MTVSEVYCRFGVMEAASSLDLLLQVMQRTATRNVDVRCARCPHLSPDEARVLQAAAALQRHDRTAAWTALASFLPLQAADFALGPVEGLAHIFQGAGWALPRRDWNFALLEEQQDEMPGDRSRSAGRSCTLH